jgi:hypothetical protein
MKCLFLARASDIPCITVFDFLWVFVKQDSREGGDSQAQRAQLDSSRLNGFSFAAVSLPSELLIVSQREGMLYSTTLRQ